MATLERKLDDIDASVFSGELLFIPEDRALLKEYAERWLRAIVEHEAPDAHI